MDPATIGYIACAVVIFLLAIRVPIAYAIGGVAVTAFFIVFATRTGTFIPERALWTTLSLSFSSSFDLVHSHDLSMIPLFIALGHIAYKAGITTEIYEAARVWLVRLPGGVAIASVAGCGGFSAISGSSIACASTMGRICTPEMLRLNYDPRLATASVAAGGARWGRLSRLRFCSSSMAGFSPQPRPRRFRCCSRPCWALIWWCCSC